MSDTNTSGSKNTEVTHNITSATGHRKGSGDLFSGMKAYKRDAENPAQEQRRASLKDMSAKPSGGFLSNMWDSTFRQPEKK